MALQWATDVSCNGFGSDALVAGQGWNLVGDTVTVSSLHEAALLSPCHMADTDLQVRLYLNQNTQSASAGISFRAVDSLRFYVAQVDPNADRVSIAISQHGVLRQLGSTGIPAASRGPWYDIRVIAIDNALELWLEGEPVLAVGDSLLHLGATGIWASRASGARF